MYFVSQVLNEDAIRRIGVTDTSTGSEKIYTSDELLRLLKKNKVTIAGASIDRNETSSGYVVAAPIFNTAMEEANNSNKYVGEILIPKLEKWAAGQSIGVKYAKDGWNDHHIMFKDVQTAYSESGWSGLVTSLYGFFEGSTEEDFSIISKFTTKHLGCCTKMFKDCKNLKSLDMRGFDTSAVYDFSWMFEGCESLTELNADSLTGKNILTAQEMFSGCKSLKKLDLHNFDTTYAANMYRMFADCSSLEYLDISKMSLINNVEDTNMFAGCVSLKELHTTSVEIARSAIADGIPESAVKLSKRQSAM